jgi:hypothetical protein
MFFDVQYFIMRGKAIAKSASSMVVGWDWKVGLRDILQLLAV